MTDLKSVDLSLITKMPKCASLFLDAFNGFTHFQFSLLERNMFSTFGNLSAWNSIRNRSLCSSFYKRFVIK